MKTFSRIIAVVMIIAMLAAVMAACGDKKNTVSEDERLYGTWKQTDEVDGDWEWTFNKGGTCSLKGITTNFESSGTYQNEGSDYGKIRVKLDGWEKEVLFTYAVTEKALDLESAKVSYYCLKV